MISCHIPEVNSIETTGTSGLLNGLSQRGYEMNLCDWSSDVCSSDLFVKNTPSRKFRNRVFTLLNNLSLMVFRVLGGYLGCSSDLGEGNGTPLQYFCLENPMDGGA